MTVRPASFVANSLGSLWTSWFAIDEPTGSALAVLAVSVNLLLFGDLPQPEAAEPETGERTLERPIPNGLRKSASASGDEVAAPTTQGWRIRPEDRLGWESLGLSPDASLLRAADPGDSPAERPAATPSAGGASKPAAPRRRPTSQTSDGPEEPGWVIRR